MHFLTCFFPSDSEQLGNLFLNRIRQIMTMSVMVTKANATTRTVTRGNGPDRGLFEGFISQVVVNCILIEDKNKKTGMGKMNT